MEGMQDVLASHPVCRSALIDSICIDAFPACSCLERTACMMACQNVTLCGETLKQETPTEFGFINNDFDCNATCQRAEECIPGSSADSINSDEMVRIGSTKVCC